jgi:ATP-binding cassette subfamily F protein 3
MSILTFYNLSQSFGAIDIFTGLAASIPHRAKIGLVGPNGVGKTTLLRIMAGVSQPKTGVIHLAKGTSVGYLHQEAEHAFADQDHTLYDEMLTVFAGLRAQEAQLREMELAMSSGDISETFLETYGALQEAFELAGGYDYEVRIRQALDGLGFKEQQQRMPLSHCSGGQKTRALLARLLLEKPDLLILDEPTNHLDVVALEWLEKTLQSWAGAMLIVSHDRYFLDRVVDNIWEMSRNGLESYRGNYSAYLHQREERWARREEEFKAARARFLKDLDFVKRNIARASTTDRAKGLLKRLIRDVKAVEAGGVQALNESWLRFTEEGPGISGEKWTVADVEQHIKALESPNPRQAQLKMDLGATGRGGNIVLRTKNLEIGYPGTPLFRADDIELLRQECAALIGPNGAGKSTFLRALVGEIQPLAGDLQLGANVKISYFAQARDQLDPNKTVLDELLSYRNMPPGEARNYLARYLFRGEEVFKPVGALSGGEQGRLALAILALHDTNFLLLDEPTNHLDIPAQEVLQEALQRFEGTILLVSHDRYLVDKLATQIWELRDHRLYVHPGNYQSFLAERERAREQAKPEKANPKEAGRQPAPANGVLSKQRELAEIERLIHNIEDNLERLSQALQTASQNQQWDNIQSLSQKYKATQTQLDKLMSRWELLSVTD